MLHRLRVIVGAAHIGPSIVVTVVTVALAAISGLEPILVVVVGTVMLLNQLSIGWSNDAIDSRRDLEAQRADKPVGRGDVDARTIMTLAAVSATFSILLSTLLGPVFAVAHLVALGSGWAYNAGLKRTLFATACYIVGFGSIPLLVTLAREQPLPAAWWAVAMGGLLGLAAHFANVLPDLEADHRHGIRSLPHRLGARPAGIIALTALAIAGVLGVIGPESISPIAVAGAAVTVALLIAGVVVIVRDPRSRWLFRIIMGAALAAVVTLAGAAGSFVVVT